MRTVVNANDRKVVSRILEENDTFVFDCDGVLWETGRAFPGAAETIKKLHTLGKKVIFVTNGNTKTRKECLDRILKCGIEATLEEVYCTSYTAALYLKYQNLGPSDVVYLVGSPAVATELDKAGINHIGLGPDDSIVGVDVTDGDHLNPNVKAVVFGSDGLISFAKITKASSYLPRKDVLFLVTNMDTTFPSKRLDYCVPGTGALVASVIAASQRQPDVICGKPDSVMLECIMKENGFDPKRAIMIGDRLDTDILFGKNYGLQTLVVMTGVTTQGFLEEVQRSEDPDTRKLVPDYQLQALGDLETLL